MSRKYQKRQRNRKAKTRKAKPQGNRQPRERQPREFSHKHRNNRAIPRHEMIVEKKPPVPSFPTQQQDAENRWFYHVLRLQNLSM